MRLAVQISGRWRGRVRLPEGGVLALEISLREVKPGEMQACGVGDEEVIRGQDQGGPESAARARFRSDAWRSSARQEARQWRDPVQSGDGGGGREGSTKMVSVFA